MSGGPILDTQAAFERYEAIRPRLPQARFPAATQHAPSLSDVAQAYDGFVLDAFGVLNVGETAIPGAVERMAELRSRGKALLVLTNAASYTVQAAAARYRAMGFDFAEDEIVSSRAVTAQHLQRVAPDLRWAAIAAAGDRYEDIPADVCDLLADETLWRAAGGFLFLSGARWTRALQAKLMAALRDRPRPVVVANPDLVAPRGQDLSIEPGYWGQDIEDATGVSPIYFGKPFGNAFDAAFARLGPGHFAMVGDTLHTDILGGRAARLGTVLITRHGLFAGHDTAPFVTRSGIVPDWTVATT